MPTTNKLTPRLETVSAGDLPGAEWVSIDIGIWPGESGRHLTMMVYHQGRGWRPAVGKLKAWEAVLVKERELWERHACARCRGQGCAACGETGWARFAEWKAHGGKRDADNYPVLPK